MQKTIGSDQTYVEKKFVLAVHLNQFWSAEALTWGVAQAESWQRFYEANDIYLCSM